MKIKTYIVPNAFKEEPNRLVTSTRGKRKQSQRRFQPRYFKQGN